MRRSSEDSDRDHLTRLLGCHVLCFSPGVWVFRVMCDSVDTKFDPVDMGLFHTKALCAEGLRQLLGCVVYLLVGFFSDCVIAFVCAC